MCYKPKFCLKNIVQKGKRFSRLPEAQIVAPDGKSCSKVTKHNLTCKQALLFGREGPRNAPCGLAARSRVLARLASLAQIGELARRLLILYAFSFINFTILAALTAPGSDYIPALIIEQAATGAGV